MPLLGISSSLIAIKRGNTAIKGSFTVTPQGDGCKRPHRSDTVGIPEVLDLLSFSGRGPDSSLFSADTPSLLSLH